MWIVGPSGALRLSYAYFYVVPIGGESHQRSGSLVNAAGLMMNATWALTERDQANGVRACAIKRRVPDGPPEFL